MVINVYIFCGDVELTLIALYYCIAVGATIHLNVESLLVVPVSIHPHRIGEKVIDIKQALDATMTNGHYNSDVDLSGIIVAGDRGYTNPQMLIDSVKKDAEGYIGTHQRHTSMPFTYGKEKKPCRYV